MLFILQHIKTGEFRICLKELYANQHDPVNVTYTVLAGRLEGEKKSSFAITMTTNTWINWII